jgi:protein gp37
MKLHHKNIPNGLKVFICSTFELFHSVVKEEWRNEIFEIIEDNPKITFQILTKLPQNIDREMPNNVWLGMTVTGEPKSVERNKLNIFQHKKARVKFISYEPVLSEVPFELTDKIDWLIIGALTGHSYKNRYRPHVVYLQRIIKSFKEDGTKIFLKDNLKSIWKDKLIQEYPE